MRVMTKPVILTGLRANNNLTIGNYFGAMMPIIDMAKNRSAEYQVNMFIPDLHSFTTPVDHSKLYEQILHTAKLFVAAGLPINDEGIHIYRQSQVSAHSELTWILDCFTGFGQMTRMTQFKDKSLNLAEVEKRTNEFMAGIPHLNDADYMKLKNLIMDMNSNFNESNTSVGLFNYPVLMAADILLYGAQYVPVGDDQTQHLEYTRDIAERMNNRFDDVFTVPEPVAKQHEFFGKDQGLRIKDLLDPSKKMSKSDESGRGVIFLSDEPDVAAKKIMSATTDDLASVRYDKVNQPGISNLLDILALLRNQPVAETAAEFEGQSRYGDFKAVVAEEMKQFLIDFQMRLASVADDDVMQKLEASENAMRIQANETLLRVQRAIGLRSGRD